MKKVYLGLALTVISLSSTAAPQLGDFAVLNGVLIDKGDSYAASERIENIQIDVEGKKVLIRDERVFEGQSPQVEEAWYEMKNVFDKEAAQSLGANPCEYFGEGIVEVVETPVGTFNTCKSFIDWEDRTVTYWQGAVPGTYVKYEIQQRDGLNYSVLLNQYSWK